MKNKVQISNKTLNSFLVYVSISLNVKPTYIMKTTSVNTQSLLKFSPGNAKLVGIPSISLLAGWACPFANKCFAKVDLVTGKIIDGPDTEFRCFSATQENIFPNTRKQRQHNFELLKALKSEDDMAALIQSSLPKEKFKVIRIHVAGDFFNQKYFDAWAQIARNNPDRIFYAYTKSLQYWVNRLGQIPDNFKLTASKGGKLDHLISEYNLKFAQVVYSEKEANDLGLEIDHDDKHAYLGDKSFGLLIHGTQKAGSKASKAKQALADKGWSGYARTGGYKNKTFKKAA